MHSDHPSMKLPSRFLANILLSAAICLMAFTHLAIGAPRVDRPNVVFILADDLGWSDVTIHGHTKLYQTPNLERLAKRGLVFSRAYSASPLCSPTRASILTGQNPARIGLTSPDCHMEKVKLKPTLQAKAPPHSKALMCESITRLDTSYFTLAEALREEGYATGHFGKWHLGPPPYSPLEQGFDVDVPHWPGPGPAGSFVAPWKFPDFDPDPAIPDQHIEDRMAAEASSFMEKHKEQPFFLNYWMFSVHAPFDAKKPRIQHYRGKVDPADAQRSPTYAAMVESMDDAVGTLLDTIDRLGIADHTAIVFVSDNGGNMYDKIDGTSPTSNRPLRGGKATLFEGGIRIPCIVSWPGVTQGGGRSAELIETTDFYPTFLSLLKLKPQPGQVFDGVDASPALRGGSLDRKELFSFFPHSPPIVPDHLPPSISMTTGDWKLIRIFHGGNSGAHDYQLYHLGNDIGEKHNLAADNPAKVAELDAKIEAFLKRTHALVPKPNPDYDPTAPVPAPTSKKRPAKPKAAAKKP